jgi:hypothetical protein
MMRFVPQVRGLKRQHASQAVGFAAVTIAGAVLIGWWAGLPMLSTWARALPPRNPWRPCASQPSVSRSCTPARTRASRSRWPRGGRHRCARSVWCRFRYQPLARAAAAVPGPGAASFEMINGMPLAIALAGGSLALSRFEGHHFTVTVLAGLAGGMAVFALLTYLTGIHALYSTAAPPAPPTVVGLLCIAGAIVLRVGTMPALRKARPLWQLQVMLGCAIIAPLLLFGVYTGARIAVAQLRLVQNELMSEARILSAGVDRVIIGEIERLQALAASPSLRQGDLAEF